MQETLNRIGDSTMTILIDSSEMPEGLPKFDDKIRCSEHPKYPSESGFGLAGGGYGPYTVCPICCKLLSKTNENEGNE